MTDRQGRSRVAPWAARLLAALATALAGMAVALPMVSGYGYLPELMGTPEVVVAASFSITGALLVGSAPARRIGWLLLVIGLFAALYTSALSWTAFVLEGDETAELPAGSDFAHLTAWLTSWAWLPSWLLVSTVLPQVVPYGRPLSPLWRIPLWAAAVVLVLGVATLSTAPGPMGLFEGTDNPFAVPALAAVLDPLGGFLDVAVLALIGLSVVSVVVRVVRADGPQRRQVGWVGYAVTLCVVAISLVPSIWVNAAVLLIPADIAVSALRYRLYDLDLLVNRTLVAALLVGAAAVAYVALVAWVGSLVGTSTGVTPFLAALAVALSFHPARVRVQRAVDRLFFGRRGDPLTLIRELDRTLRDASSPRTALDDAVHVVQGGLRLPGVAVVVGMPSGEEVRAQAGTVGPGARTFPLVLHDQEVGRLAAAPRRPGGALGDADVRALAALAGPMASAAYALRLSGDLEESRRRLIDAREEERRLLRRDLHDGLGPQLAGVVMGLDVVRSAMSRGDTDRALDLTGVVTDQAREAVEDVRRLASGLRPPVLDDLGLVGALRSTGPAAVPDGPVVRVHAEGDLDDLPAALEVAAYRIAQEAMTNAVRHAGAGRIDVRLRGCVDALTLEVRDDGSGLAETIEPGVGLTSMRARAAELGGWCAVSRGDVGAVVTAHLPRRS